MIEIIYTLIVTHITIMCVTLYLHRGVTHRAITIDPRLAHFMRFWLWLTTGMVTKEWVAIHRKHHQLSDQEGDPHSPQIYGIWRVLFGGAVLYTQASKNKDMVKRLGVGAPDDWMENNFYGKYSNYGILLMLLIDVLLFGWTGCLVWAVQMMWIPFWAAGVINGLAHYIGYRNYETKDTARNLFPFGVWIGGEELHNNHHNNGAAAKFSNKWYEFDIGWMYIKVFERLGLVKVRD
jgi:stearoyl-CoA desaturase (Delta-9 desaturase)